MVNEPKVFCVGHGKTGTSSFGRLLAQLGYNHLSGPVLKGLTMSHLDPVPVLELAEKYDSFDDYPWPYLYEQLATRFPDARFVLTTRRSTDRWLASLQKHVERRGPIESHLLAFGSYTPSDWDSLKDLYETHNQNVREYFRGNPNFIEICIDDQGSWTRLLSFLNAPDIEPETIPRVNTATSDTPERTVHKLCKAGKFATALQFAEKYESDHGELTSYLRAYLSDTLKKDHSHYRKFSERLRVITRRLAKQPKRAALKR